MKNTVKKTALQKHAEKIRMRAIERRELRDRILSYMEYHPLPKQQNTILAASQSARDTYIESETFTYINLAGTRLRAAIGAFVVLLVVGVPFAAERAVPGDVLYPVKVRFNEEVRSGLTLTPYQKVAWETELVERRIAEARLLASEGKLTEETEAAFSEEIKARTEAVQKELEVLREDDADEAAVAQVALESALEVQSAVLAEEAHASSTGSSVEGLAELVNEVRDDVMVSAEGASSTPSYEGFIARVEAETTRARELFNSINGAATNVEKRDIERRIEDGERAIAKAQDEHEDKDTEAAIELLREALANTQKLIVFMTDIDIRESIALEKLVPKTLTDEERTTAINQTLEGVRTIRGAVSERLAEIEDESVEEKIAGGLEELESLITDIDAHVSEGELDSAETALVAATELAEDLNVLTATNNEDEVVDETATEEESEEGEEGEESEEAEETLDEDTVEQEDSEESDDEVADEESSETVGDETTAEDETTTDEPDSTQEETATTTEETI